MQATATMDEQNKKHNEHKKELEQFVKDNAELKRKYKELLKDKEEIESQIQEKKNKNVELERTIVRLEERISILQEDRKKTELLIKDVIKKSDTVFYYEIYRNARNVVLTI